MPVEELPNPDSGTPLAHATHSSVNAAGDVAAAGATRGHRAARQRRFHRRFLRRLIIGTAVIAALTGIVIATGWAALLIENHGTPNAAAHSTGNDGLWLGHGWVDGRKTQADVDALAGTLRGTGIHDLFVHTGPLADDGTLDPALRPRARWLITALHDALPDVRVQAWLGDVVGDDRLDLASASTRAHIVQSAGQALADGFDGIHYDFEPVPSGTTGLLDVLAATRALTSVQPSVRTAAPNGAQNPERHAVLSIAATYLEPVHGLAPVVGALPGHPCLWSKDYLHQVALRVDQVALMAYDTALPTRSSYAGYVRRQTALALSAVPADVTLMIGLPAYHTTALNHHPGAETVRASLRGIRLALGSRTPQRPFGVSLYVDFTATQQDWASYRADWLS